MGLFGNKDVWGPQNFFGAIRENLTHPLAQNPEGLVEVRLPSQPGRVIPIPINIPPRHERRTNEEWDKGIYINRVTIDKVPDFTGMNDIQVIQALAHNQDIDYTIPYEDSEYIVNFFKGRFNIYDEEWLGQIREDIDQCESVIFLLMTFYGEMWERIRIMENEALQDIVNRANVQLSPQELKKFKIALKKYKIGGLDLLSMLNYEQRSRAARLIKSTLRRSN